ncbi:MAG: GNAT family N-acetyltransferase, partial [Granulosicoccus sp.]|nr:GNAT family N-acetyltransferase [Granulosicoccus sp.]
NVVQEILTERVTQNLPPSWQGSYNLTRAHHWINDRDKEGTNLLAVDKAGKQAIGMIILFESEASSNLRLGYMLNESAWGKGFASELVGGFVNWCRHHDIHSVTGGVEQSNIASRRVLEKCGFQAEPDTHETGEQLFTLRLL